MGVLYVVPAPKAADKTIDIERIREAKVLVVGSGGREHAIVDALSRSLEVTKIWCAPGNAGIASQAECVPIGASDIQGLLAFAQEHHVDMTVVGPEVPLSEGIADAFMEAGMRIFGPSAAAARIESSKDFAKNLMAKYDVPTASFKTFSDFDEAMAYVRERPFPQVLKYDGLAAGKGVTIPQTLEEAEADLRSMLLDDMFGEGKVVIEDFLTGPEFSMMCLVDGERVFPLALAQDHKRAYEDDKGPNTGGMGAYSPLPFISDEDEKWALEHIMKPVAAAMVAEGTPFRGLLYGGLMKTPSGIKVIEFNCRFGDPETEVVLPRLESDFYRMLSAVVDGTDIPRITWSEDAVIGFVMASKGYPGSYEKGHVIEGLSENALGVEGCDDSVRVYHMGTKSSEGKILTAGGRVLMVTGRGETLAQASASARAAISRITCDNLFYRPDIGWQAL
ncbi:MAG: phosphoribosylamine--glycine ligase [Bacteroidales bacterium]|nr:phosphoribosylamine--glycine ligase [Bacteroidales bacterium]